MFISHLGVDNHHVHDFGVDGHYVMDELIGCGIITCAPIKE